MDQTASSSFGIRLSTEERDVIERAADAARELGDRGGASSWARRVLLREAQAILALQPSTKEPA